MSFGWSAGDIAAAIKLAHRVYEALDSAHGAPHEYREATSFLRELTRTLEPLQSFAKLGAYPEYGKEIADRVSFIKEPVENLLREIVKLEPKLGIGSKSARHRHVLPKLNWHFSKKVLALRAQIECHMRVLETLLQRLTLDIVSTIQRTLPDVFVSVFQERIRPELVRILREIVDTQQQQRNTGVNLSHEIYTELLSQIEDLKASSRDVQVQLKKYIPSGGRPFTLTQPTMVNSSSSSDTLPDPVSASVQALRQRMITGTISTAASDVDPELARESLREVYYLVLLYLGEFLKNILHLLSRYTRPSRQLVPMLLAHRNITFLDPLGHPPRIFPYEYFKNFKIFRVFLNEELFPGMSLVQRGQHLLLSNLNNLRLDENNWRRHVKPGSTVSMAALMLKPQRLENGTSRCPDPECKGTSGTHAFETWSKCPVCGKEVLTLSPQLSVDPISSPVNSHAGPTSDQSGEGSSPDSQGNAKTVDPSELRAPERAQRDSSDARTPPPRDNDANKTDQEFSIFKRIVQLPKLIVDDDEDVTDVFFDWIKGPLETFYCAAKHMTRNETHLPWMADQFYELSISLRQAYFIVGKNLDDTLKVAGTPRSKNADDYVRGTMFTVFSIHGGHLTYEATEINKYKASRFYLPLSIIRSIYSMGCVFLEYITWFIGGEEAANRFTDLRTTQLPNEPNFKIDTFYTLSQDMSSATKKKEVGEWIEYLCIQPNCSPYLLSLIKFIDTRMLEIDPLQRAGIEEVKGYMRYLRDECRRSKSLYQFPQSSI